MKLLAVVSMLLLVTACARTEEPGYSGGKEKKSLAIAETAERRHIAHEHHLDYSAPAEAVLLRFAAIEGECVKLGCIILEATRTSKVGNEDPEASLTARLPPAAFNTFLNHTGAANELVRHRRTSDDKTVAVIDAEARIKNLTALKARILELLEKRAGDMAEVLEAEKQLGEIQSQLDTIVAVRKVLASETEMVKFTVRLSAERVGSRSGALAPVSEAIGESGQMLMRSAGNLILFLVSVLPWLVVLVPLFLWIRKLLRARRARLDAKLPG